MAAKHVDQDDFILTLLHADDQQAMNIIFDTYFSELLQRTEHYTGDRQVAKDIVQELLVTIWHERHHLNITKPIRKYLMRAIHNRALNVIRNQQKFKTFTQPGAEPMSSADIYRYAADRDLRHNELEGMIHLAIDSLPEKLREPFWLSRNTEMTHKQIAAHLQVSEIVVQKRIMKALKLIKTRLNKYLKS